MRKLFMFLLSTGLFTLTMQAQKISGTVKDDQGKGLEKTTVSVLRAKDSVSVKFGATDKTGTYILTLISPGDYIVKITHVGYGSGYSKPFTVTAGSDVTVPGITIMKTAATLSGVSVTSKKPMVEVKADKTILNVEGTINATGVDALELLRKSPGVLVDKDDNISLSGKSGVQIYIDGKPTPLSGSDLASYLKSIQSSQIESIELITNPSAKYEAAGNAGIINIRLKKNKTFGTNGSVNAGWNIGTYPKYNGGVALNYRNRKINLFGNYNYNNSKNQNQFHLFRTTDRDSSFDQSSTMVNKSESHGFKAGMDFYASKTTTVGVMVNGNLNDNSTNNQSITNIAYMPSKLVDRLLVANNKASGSRDNVNFNANYRYADTSGHELNIDADYGFYNSNNTQNQPNKTYNANNGTLIQDEAFLTYTPSNIDIFSTKIDYEQNFKKGKLGVGGKFSYVQTDNTFERFVPTSGNLKDNLNNFHYNENINALYVSYNRQLKGIMLQAGLRVENTHQKGRSTGFRYNYQSLTTDPIDTLFDRNYTDPFPSASVTFNKNPMKQWSISYSRRIDRPSYQNLNPFEFNLDKYTFQRGNPNLKPQYTNSFAITNVYKYRLTTTLNYSHIADLFSIVPKSEGTKAFITNDNIANQNIISLNVSYPFQYKKYMLFFNLNSYYSHVKGDRPDYHVDINVFSFNIYAQQSLKVAKFTTVEMSGFYTAPSVWQGAIKSKGLGSLDMGVQQTVLQGKGTIKATVTDVLGTFHWAGTSNTTGQTLKVNGNWESRQFRINFSYRFGSNQVKAARQRKAGSDDEDKRTQGGGGLGAGGN